MPNAWPTVVPSERVDVVERKPYSRLLAIQRAVSGCSDVGGGLEPTATATAEAGALAPGRRRAAAGADGEAAK